MDQHGPEQSKKIEAPRSRLEFMVIQTPSDTSNHAFRRQVRSHVTKVQHQRTRLSALTGVDYAKEELHSDRHRVRRKKTDGQAKFRATRVEKPPQATKKPTPPRQDAATASRRASKDLTLVRESTSQPTVEASSGGQAARAGASGSTTGGVRKISQPRASNTILEQAVGATTRAGTSPAAHGNQQPALPGSAAAVAFSQGTMATRTFVFHDQDNVVGIVLKHLRSDLASVLVSPYFV